MPAKTTRKIGVCPEGGPAHPWPFSELYPHFQNIKEKGIEDCDAVLFWGGTDIHPSIYGASKNIMSGAGNAPSARDEFELKAMRWCKATNTPMIGVCRGAQLMCAFAGGSLAQHVTGHGQSHRITTLRDGEVMSTSSHHQMMNISGTAGQLVAWSSERLSTCYLGENSKDILAMRNALEPEIVWFPSIRGLAIQGHPEWCHSDKDPFVLLCNRLVQRYILGEDV